MLGFVVAGDFCDDFRRNVGVVNHFLGHLDHITQHHAFTDDGGHADHTLTVLTLDVGRGQGFDHGAKVANAHGLSVAVVYLDVFDVLDARAELRGVAHTDVVFVAVLAIVGGDRAADAVLDVGGCRRAVHAVEC